MAHVNVAYESKPAVGPGRRSAFMIHCEANIEIARPVAVVFAFVDDDTKATQWLSMCHSLELRSPPPKRVGSELVYSYKEGRGVRSMDVVITVYERPHRVETKLTDKLFEMVIAHNFESSALGTRVEVIMDITPQTFLTKLMSPMVRMATQKLIEKDLAKLKSLLESNSR